MITPELITYVREKLAAGIPREHIAELLIPNGWSTQDIKQAFVEVSTSTSASVSVAQNTTAASFTGRKVLLSLCLVIASAAYAFYQVVINPPQISAALNVIPTSGQNTPVSAPAPIVSSAPAVQPTQSQTANTTTTNQTPVASAPPPQPAATPTPTPTPAPTPAGQYKDGTYTGNSADAYYGSVQVQAVVQNGALGNVQILQYPNSHGTSVYINQQALPILVNEALQVQSANVDIVSGATFTSQAFQQSLQSALAQAQN